MGDIDDDYLLAVSLQEELNAENIDQSRQAPPMTAARQRKNIRIDEANNVDLNETSNIAHPDWEVVDPTPDVQSMFVAFNFKFFQGKLECVQLEWSKRMYSCAGICYSRRNRYGMQCTIRLSEPLLKLRSRKNLVETLLHEMIHAYLFILNIREENGGHGPNFKKIMIGINKAAGTNITVYHTFYDEVQLYKTHWWRCNGICQHRKPFFGFVKRTCNRAPGPTDRWWVSHHNACGGTFEKIKEPEKPGKKGGANRKAITEKTTSTNGDIRRFIAPGVVKGGKMNSGSNTVVVRKPPATNVSTVDLTGAVPKTTNKTGNLINVVGIRDLNSDDDEPPQKVKKEIPLFTGVGHSLSQTTSSDRRVPDSESKSNDVKESIRNIWAKRFPSVEIDLSCETPKKPKLEEPSSSNSGNDDDIFIIESENPVIDICDSDEDNELFVEVKEPPPRLSAKEVHQRVMKELQDSDDECHEDDDDEDDKGAIVLIDDEYDDTFLNSVTELADTSVIDDLFGEDTLLKNFMGNNDRDLVCTSSDIDFISCPLCQESMLRHELCIHLDWCQGIRKDVKPKSFKTLAAGSREASKPKILGNWRPPKRKVPPKPSNPSQGIGSYFLPTSSSTSSTSTATSASHTPKVICPVCNQPQAGDLNDHLDNCLIID